MTWSPHAGVCHARVVAAPAVAEEGGGGPPRHPVERRAPRRTYLDAPPQRVPLRRLPRRALAAAEPAARAEAERVGAAQAGGDRADRLLRLQDHVERRARLGAVHA